MKKRLLTILLTLLLALSLCPGAFALTGESARAADTLAALGLVTGTPDGYALESEASIEQAAVLLVRLLGESDVKEADCGWAGIPGWAKQAVNYCAVRGLIRHSEYEANAALSAEQWCAMLLRAVGFDDQNADFTLAGAVAAARRVGLIARDLGGTLSRGTLFESAANALRYSRTADGESLAAALVRKGAADRAVANALGLLDRTLTAREIADRYTSAGICLELYYDEDAIAKGESSSTASAFFITEDGIAVTNYHSIDDAIYATGTLATGEIVEVEDVLYYDRKVDIAVIRFAREDVNKKALPAFLPLKLVGPSEARVGDKTYTISNPLGQGLALTSGIISATEHMVELSTLPCIICDASISHGSSGGALMNEFGEVLGVTTGAYAKGNNMFIAVSVEPLLSLDLDRLEAKSIRQVVNEVDAAIKAEEAEEHNIVG